MPMPASDIEIEDLFETMINERASDLHLTVGSPPVLRYNTALQPLDIEPLKPEDTERFVRAIAPEEHLLNLNQCGGADFGFGYGTQARFRVSIFRQRGHAAMVMRMIPSDLISLEQIGLSKHVQQLLYRSHGLILVTGPTGSGKTTTLASMLDFINENRDCHILTIEDPIEYYHTHKRSLITQREVGTDVPTFAEAIRRGLRQDPDVILVGELRDLETMEAAITAAETGHLVLATLHTSNASQTINRMVDAFPSNQQEQVRTQLADSLVAVISQLLFSRQDQIGLVSAFEILIATPSIRSLIRENKTVRINSDIQTGGKWGMIQMDSYLLQLYRKQIISYEDMMEKAQDAEALQHELR